MDILIDAQSDAIIQRSWKQQWELFSRSDAQNEYPKPKNKLQSPIDARRMDKRRTVTRTLSNDQSFWTGKMGNLADCHSCNCGMQKADAVRYVHAYTRKITDGRYSAEISRPFNFDLRGDSCQFRIQSVYSRTATISIRIRWEFTIWNWRFRNTNLVKTLFEVRTQESFAHNICRQSKSLLSLRVDGFSCAVEYWSWDPRWHRELIEQNSPESIGGVISGHSWFEGQEWIRTSH